MSWAVGISIISGWLVGLFTGLGKGEGGGVTMQHTTRSVVGSVPHEKCRRDVGSGSNQAEARGITAIANAARG